jgi:mRNA interferase RelE/StbE
MAWKIEFARSAAKELGKLDKQVVQRILKFLKERVEQNPRAVGEPLKGDLSPFWRYRVGDYRLYADIDDNHITVLIVKVGHRKNVYE